MLKIPHKLTVGKKRVWFSIISDDIETIQDLFIQANIFIKDPDISEYQWWDQDKEIEEKYRFSTLLTGYVIEKDLKKIKQILKDLE